MGFVVSVRLSAPSALADARRVWPDVIVLDLDLPHRAGWDVLGGLRRDRATRGIPVVGLSHGVAPDEREEARGLGAVLVSKPCEPDALYLAVSKAAAAAARDRG